MSEPTRMELTYGIDFDRVQHVTEQVDGRMVERTHYPITVGDREISWVTTVSTEDDPTRVLAWRPAGAPDERGRYLAEAGSAAPHEFDTVLDAATALYTHHVATQQYLAGARTVAPLDLVSLDELDRVDDQPAPEPRAAAGWEQRVADWRAQGWDLRQAELLASGISPADLVDGEPECGGCGGPVQFGIGAYGELCTNCTDALAAESDRDQQRDVGRDEFGEYRAAAGDVPVGPAEHDAGDSLDGDGTAAGPTRRADPRAAGELGNGVGRPDEMPRAPDVGVATADPWRPPAAHPVVAPGDDFAVIGAAVNRLDDGPLTDESLALVGVTPDQFDRYERWADAREDAARDAQREAERDAITGYADDLTRERATEIADQAAELTRHMQGCHLSVENCATCCTQERDAAARWWQVDVPAAHERLGRDDTYDRRREATTATPQPEPTATAASRDEQPTEPAGRPERALRGAEAAIARIDQVAADNDRAIAADRSAHLTRWAADDRATTADRDTSLTRELF